MAHNASQHAPIAPVTKECRSPAEAQRDRRHDQRGDDGPERRAAVSDGCSARLPIGRQRFRGCFESRGKAEPSPKPSTLRATANPQKPDIQACAVLAMARNETATNIPFAQTDEIEERAEQRIPDHVENRECRECVRVGLRAEAGVAQDHRRKHRQHLAVDVREQSSTASSPPTEPT
jgi:hypothetical protein